MIINRLPAGGGGFQLPPSGTTEQFTYTVLTEPTLGSEGELINYGTCRLTGFNFSGNVSTSVTVPQYFGNYKATQISNMFFNTGNFGTLTKIVVPFDFEWFATNTSYTSKKINSQITEIVANISSASLNYAPFYNADSLTKFTSNYTYTSANQNAFYNTKLTDYNELVKFITSCYYSSFSKSTVKGTEFQSLTNIQNSGSENGAFFNCSSIINANFANLQTIGDTNTSFGTGNFANCNSMKTIKIPKCVYIGIKTFENCINLNSIYLEELPNINFGSQSSHSPFNNCSKLTNIYISEDKVDALKEVFNSAPYSSYGTNLAQYVKATPVE